MTLIVWHLSGGNGDLVCHFEDWIFSGVLCEFLWRFGYPRLTPDRKCAKTTRPRHISKVIITTKTLLSNWKDTPHTLRGNSYYKKQKHIYKRFFNRFLCVLGRFSKYKCLEDYDFW